MYSISFYQDTLHSVVGELRAILATANLCEKNKVPFKVASVAGYQLKQADLGCGGFDYWLNPDDHFGKE